MSIRWFFIVFLTIVSLNSAYCADIFDITSDAIVKKICDNASLKSKNIAITSFDNKVGDAVDADEFQAKLTTALLNKKYCRIVVKRDKVNECMKELKLMASGLVEPETQKKLGKLLGAEYLLIGTISNGITGESLSISADLVQVETGAIILSEYYTQPANAKGQRIMIVVPETHINRFLADPAGETELIKMFTEAGCTVIDQIQYAAIRNSPDMEAAIKDRTGLKARSLTTKYGADILIIGEAVSEFATRNNGIINCRARIEVRAVATRGDARILAACDGVGAGADIAESTAAKIALRKAGNEAGNYLLKRLFNIDPPKLPAQKPTIAITPFDNQSSWRSENWKLEQKIPDLITVSLVKNRNISVIERTNFEDIIGTQGGQINGLYDNVGKSAQLGTLAKADYILVGKITEYDVVNNSYGLGIFKVNKSKATVKLLIKVIKVDKGTIAAATEAVGEDTGAGVNVNDYMRQISFGSNDFNKSTIGVATRKAVEDAVKSTLDTIQFNCPDCNAEVILKDNFCPECMNKLLWGNGPEDVVKKCTKCQAVIKPKAKGCTKCGQKVE